MPLTGHLEALLHPCAQSSLQKKRSGVFSRLFYKMTD